MTAAGAGGVFLLLTLVLILSEAFWRRRTGRAYDWPDTAASFGVALGNILLGGLTGQLSGKVFSTLAELPPFQIETGDWRAWLAGCLLVEFLYYWMHRWSHTIRWMWASHSVHHSANSFTLPAAIRLGWTSFLSGAWLVFAPMALLGFPPDMILVLLAANLKYQFLLHTELIGRLGPLEWVFNTPSHHRVHHGANEQCLDRNYGGVLIIFDRLFGTFVDERTLVEPIRYGLTRPITSHNPVIIALREWADMARDFRKAKTARGAFTALWRVGD